MKIIKPKPKLHKIAQVICQALKQTLNFYTFTKSLSSLLNSATSLMPLIVDLLSVLGLKCPGAEVSRRSCICTRSILTTYRSKVSVYLRITAASSVKYWWSSDVQDDANKVQTRTTILALNDATICNFISQNVTNTIIKDTILRLIYAGFRDTATVYEFYSWRPRPPCTQFPKSHTRRQFK